MTWPPGTNGIRQYSIRSIARYSADRISTHAWPTATARHPAGTINPPAGHQTRAARHAHLSRLARRQQGSIYVTTCAGTHNQNQRGVARVASIVFYPNIQALFNFELNDFVLMFHFHCFILRVQSLDQDIQHLFLSSYLQHKICTHDKQGCYMQKHSFHFY